MDHEAPMCVFAREDRTCHVVVQPVADISPLLAGGVNWDIRAAAPRAMGAEIELLPGEPWKDATNRATLRRRLSTSAVAQRLP